jgi:hypothetical protein
MSCRIQVHQHLETSAVLSVSSRASPWGTLATRLWYAGSLVSKHGNCQTATRSGSGIRRYPLGSIYYTGGRVGARG